MTILRRIWAWLTLAVLGALAALGIAWRRAVRRADEAEADRDTARRSAERERDVAAKIAAAEERARVRREEIAARLEEARARHTKAVEDRVEAEHRVAVEVAETGSAAAEVNRRLRPKEMP